MTRAERKRVGWFAGTRSEVLRLAPLYQSFATPGGRHDVVHWFALTGEQGVPVFQSVDLLNLHPDEIFELRHPAEDPAIRLMGVMADVEGFLRRHHVDTAIVSGFGPTALATALICHARGRQAVWIRPHDPLRLIERHAWERGVEPLIRAVPGIRIIRAGAPGAGCEDAEDFAPPRTAWIEGRRPGAPLALLSFGRGLWGIGGGFARIAAATGAWARARPDADWVLLSALDARLEGELRSMPDRPPNLIVAGPLPLSEYRAALAEACLVAADSFNIASEALAAGVPVLALGELPEPPAGRAAPPDPGKCLHVELAGLAGDSVKAFFGAAFGRLSAPAGSSNASIWLRSDCVRRALARIFEGQPADHEATENGTCAAPTGS